jgi:CRP/FNR family transcriptional regulator, cyclic AMP receptor protein
MLAKGSCRMNEDALAHVDLFSNLDKKELQELAKSCQERSYHAGTTLIVQGDNGVGLYIVKSGNVQVTLAQDPDKAEENLGVFGPGSVLGEMSLLDELPRSATATALDDVTALILPVWEFRAFLRGQPDVALKLLRELSRRLRNAEARKIE